MPPITRPNGSNYFATLPGIDPDIGAAIDDELNEIVAAANALDNSNIADSPKIAGDKVDLSEAGFLPETGGALSDTLIHNFDGIFRLMRASGNGRIREYRGSDGAIWGISYNTSWTGSAWAGRDTTDICLALKLESDGLHLYYAASGAAGAAPSFTEVFHMNATGRMEVGTPRDNSLTEAMVDWANAGAIGQSMLQGDELSTTNAAFGTINTVKVYIPANATTMEHYIHFYKVLVNTAHARLTTDTHNGTDLSTSSGSYVWSSAGSLDISDKSGWTDINIQAYTSDGSNATYVREIVYRFI